jgi:hypothetical protein
MSIVRAELWKKDRERREGRDDLTQTQGKEKSNQVKNFSYRLMIPTREASAALKRETGERKICCPHGIILEPAAAIGYDCIQELNT